jgi:hypothetical protein
MTGTQNSISSLLAQFLRLQKNSLEILSGLNQATVSTNDTVSIEVLDEQGLPKMVNVPSYGYLKGQIERLDNNVKSLAGIGDSSATIRNPDGTYSMVYKSEPMKNPTPLTNLPVPGNFYVKDNWFFESFLSPLLYVSIDVTGKIPDSADRITMKRIIANTDTDAKVSYFDTNLKGRNDLTYTQFTEELLANGINYFVDEDVIDLPLRTLRFVGSFGVISYYDDLVNVTDSLGNTFKETRRNYKLDKLTYTDTQSNVRDGRSLNVNDKISTQDGSQYLVTSVDRDQNSIQVKRISGYQPIPIGSDVITITSPDFGPRYIQVNIGYNERQGVFFKTIDDNFNLVGSNWSTGIAFWSNELTTKKSNGDVVNLETYYKKEVSDMGQLFLGMAKEKKVSAVQGLTPDVPTVSTENFKVVQINKQVTDSTSVRVISDKLKMKSSLKAEIASIDDAINKSKLQLNAGLATADQNDIQLNKQGIDANSILGSNLTSSTIKQINNPIGVNVDSVKTNLNNLINERVKKVQLYSSIVEEVGTIVQDVPQIITEPKYRVRGFWPIPAPKNSPETGDQAVIQFKVRYRYLTDSGSSQPSQEIEYVDIDGAKKVGSFSNWNEYKTEIRKKVYDENTGLYVWSPEFTSDSNVQNINQLDIPITKGEKVEIQIASISEAGWPDNPLTSEYSESVTISFPDDLSVNGVSNLLAQNNEDKAVVKVQASLDAQGLPTHLSQQFTTGDITYYHDSSGIASGFYTSSGLVISLFDKITDLQNQLNLLKADISKAKGVLEVYLVDASGNKVKISKGSSVKLNGGFYSDIFTDPLGNDAGKIASINYSIQIFNSEASALELASIMPGGISTRVPSAISGTYPFGYNDNLRYGEATISISGLLKPDVASNQDFRQAPPYASSSAYSQFIYPRYKSVGFDQVLVNTQNTSDLSSYFTYSYNSSYAYDGSSSTTQINFGVPGTYPQNGTIFTPYDPAGVPASVSGATASNIWNGSFSAVTGGTPIGGGKISEFCIDYRHPYLVSIGDTNGYSSYPDLVKPYVSPFEYAPFRHTQSFWGDTTLSAYWVQQGYRTPITFAAGATASKEDYMYSDKLGFSSNDEYLIGKFSCGAYLFLSPSDGNSLQVPGTTSLSTKQVLSGESNAINVPLIFQFRAVDKSGYIGGWRKAGNLSNITYTKKIGIDIQVLNSDSFSFDIQVTGSYQNDTLVSPNFNSGLVSANF